MIKEFLIMEQCPHGKVFHVFGIDKREALKSFKEQTGQNYRFISGQNIYTVDFKKKYCFDSVLRFVSADDYRHYNFSKNSYIAIKN